MAWLTWLRAAPGEGQAEEKVPPRAAPLPAEPWWRRTPFTEPPRLPAAGSPRPAEPQAG